LARDFSRLIVEEHRLRPRIRAKEPVYQKAESSRIVLFHMNFFLVCLLESDFESFLEVIELADKLLGKDPKFSLLSDINFDPLGVSRKEPCTN
jgi:hypothetical protein